jgi:hypothetical protein
LTGTLLMLFVYFIFDLLIQSKENYVKEMRGYCENELYIASTLVSPRHTGGNIICLGVTGALFTLLTPRFTLDSLRTLA